MENTIVPPAGAADPSMAELRAMIAGTAKPEPAVTPEPKPETSETGAVPAAEPIKAATETAEPETNPEAEPELPKGVQKRIAQEAERAARAQAAIDRAVSERKAKEAEAAKLTAGEKGSEPVKTPQSSTDRPKRPQLGEAGHENESWEEFQTRESAHEDALAGWLKAEAVREFEEKQSRQAAEKSARERWDAAVAKHGAEFPALVESACALAPEGLQVAISALDNWDGVAVHLAKHPAQLKELAAAYAQNSTKAIATLGRIESSLTPETKPATAAKPLPEPLKKVGGTASASGQDFQTTVEQAPIGQLRGIVAKLKK